ncbi:hypothetical protein MNBD_GAMMA22-2312 [hydrothermal vent metagenome]|uniref:CheW-like domain-containing protein n=1 Tax=hydrothermal vent metagenome TaxID=652676 RepID=A0A3B0ZK30_9ZZZZ
MDKLFNAILEKKQLSLLMIDTMILGFDKDSVLSIESITELNSKRQSKMSSGSIQYATSELPVYTFNRNLNILVKPSTKNQFCVSLKHPDNQKLFAIMCDAIEHYDIENNNIRPIPALNYNPKSPIIAMVKKDSELVFISSAESMQGYINSQEHKHA